MQETPHEFAEAGGDPPRHPRNVPHAPTPGSGRYPQERTRMEALEAAEPWGEAAETWGGDNAKKRPATSFVARRLSFGQ